MSFIEIGGHFYDRCGDCGGAIRERKISKRHSICDECWERRAWLIENRELITIKEFSGIQASMARHTGAAKKKILALQKGSTHQEEQV